MRAVRVVLAVLGVAAVAFGLWSMRDFRFDQLRSMLLWLAGGVVLHDGVLAPLVVGVCWLAGRALPPRWRVPVAVGFVAWGTVSVMAFAVLSGKGGHADNPTLLDRDYRLAWLIATTVVILVVLVAGRIGVSRASNTRSG